MEDFQGTIENLKKDAIMVPPKYPLPRFLNVLEFEICSWRINNCKVGLTLDEFVDVCRRVVEYNKRVGG